MPGQEGAGDATDDQELANEGKVNQAKGHLKESAEKVEDAFEKWSLTGACDSRHTVPPASAEHA